MYECLGALTSQTISIAFYSIFCYYSGVENKFRPIFALFLSAILYGLYGIYARLVGMDFGIFTQSWVRYLISTLFVGSYLFIKGKKFTITKTDLWWLVVWVFSDTVSELLIFTSFNKINVGIAYFMLYVGIIFSGYIFGHILYKEKFTFVKVMAAALSVVGMCLILGASWQNENPFYIMLALVAGAACGFWYTSTAKLVNFTDWQLVFINSLSIFFITGLGALIFSESIPRVTFDLTWLGIILYVMTYIAAAKFVIYGFQKIDSHLGNLIMPLEIVFGALFGYIFLSQTLPAVAWLGGGLIFMAALLPHIVTNKSYHKSFNA